MTFRQSQDSREYFLNQIGFKLSTKLITNGTDEILELYHTGDIFKTPLGMANHCSESDMLQLTSSENFNDTVGTVNFSKFMAEAYHTTADEVFSVAIDCALKKTSGKLELDL